MRFKSRVLGLILGVLMLPLANLHADPIKDQIAEELAFIRRIFATGYAPAQWKKDHLGWDLGTQYNSALNLLNAKNIVTANDYRLVIAGLLSSTHDYHVGFQFYTTEMSRLPFTVNGLNGRYFIVWIDQTKLNRQAFPFQIGDELLTFDGRPVADVVNEVKAQVSWGVDSTDQRIAERLLTVRPAAMTLQPLQGQVMITAQRTNPAGQMTMITRELTWDYTPEEIPWNPQAPSTNLLAVNIGGTQSYEFTHPQMAWGMWQAWQQSIDATPSPFQIGGRKSFVPPLGQKIWESADSDEFHAYIYRGAQGKLIGYVRIPAYDGKDGASFTEFKKLIARFQATTDGLIIDEVDNPGGSVYYVMALMSVLSPNPIAVPRHIITLWPAMVSQYTQIIDQLSHATDDASTRAAFGGDNLDGFPINYTMGQAALTSARDIVAQWNRGVKLTTPIYLFGIDRVNPDPEVNYTKPIIVLVNELDFSGGDFFPAILQDNKRVKIFGARTAGAGGYILGVQFPSSLGLRQFSFTGSIAHRIDGQPIENLGVTPDIPYQYTLRDMTSGFVDYRDAINAAMDQEI